MADIFGSSEIVEMGIQIEKNGKDFYDTLAGQSQDEKAKGIFKYLAAEEEKHIATFQKMLDAVNKYDPPESYPGEYFAYMRALASEHVFTEENKGEEIAKGIKSDREAVDMGIKLEKDSMVFYEGIKKVVPEGQHKVIDALIAQETEHFNQLSNLRKNIT